MNILADDGGLDMQTVVEHAMVDGLVAITEVEARVEHKQLKSCNLA